MATIDDLMATGWRAFQAGDREGAERAYRRAVEHDPSAWRAWYMLGATCQMSRRLDEAVDHYRRAINLTPEFPEVWNNLGVALHGVQRVDESIAALRRALALQPDYPEAHNNLGNAFRERCEYDQADACYRRALELKPDYAEAHHNLGNNLKSQGHLDEALARYDRALSLRPDMAQVHLSRALAWLELGDFERGWPEYEWRLKCPQFAIPRFPSRAGMAVRCPAGRSCSTPTTGWATRSSSSGTPRWSGPAAAASSWSVATRSPGCWRPARGWTWWSSKADRSRTATRMPP